MGVVDTSQGRIGMIEQAPASSGDLPVLFLHGVGSDKSVWRPQFEAFGSWRRAIAADYPGYGDSEFIAEVDRDRYAAAMFALLDALEIERAHICGLSLGGVIAIVMAAQQPNRIASLTLADTFALHPDGEGIYDRSTAAAGDIGMKALAEARVDALLGIDPPAGLRDEVIATMARIEVPAYRIGAEAVWLADLRKEAAAITAPTLILCGEEDGITPPDLSRQLAKLIPHARLAFIPGAGHLSNAERPREFNRLLLECITAAD